MRLIRRSAAVKKDFKRLQKRGSDMSRLRNVVASLAAGEKLDEQYHFSLRLCVLAFQTCLVPACLG